MVWGWGMGRMRTKYIFVWCGKLGGNRNFYLMELLGVGEGTVCAPFSFVCTFVVVMETGKCHWYSRKGYYYKTVFKMVAARDQAERQFSGQQWAAALIVGGQPESGANQDLWRSRLRGEIPGRQIFTTELAKTHTRCESETLFCAMFVMR